MSTLEFRRERRYPAKAPPTTPLTVYQEYKIAEEGTAESWYDAAAPASRRGGCRPP